MRCQADQQRTQPAGDRPARTAAQGSATPAALPALTLLIDHDAGRVLVRDRDETFGYQLEYRRFPGLRSGLGWVEHGTADDGSYYRVGVSAAEVMAIARDAGREHEVAALTERAASEFERGGGSKVRAQAERLRGEVAAGRELERVSLRAIAARIVQRLEAGEPLTAMCARGGFMEPGGRADTSWFKRRAGLRAGRCSRTGRLRRERTASYGMFCRLVRAVDATPDEFGV